MGFIAGDSVLDAAYGYGMVCDVIRNPDETYPVICGSGRMGGLWKFRIRGTGSTTFPI